MAAGGDLPDGETPRVNVNAPDRDRIPGARPLVACLADGDDPAFEDEVRAMVERIRTPS